ncbi:MAG TPA: NAD(P) transhydrogenase subunit alpha [Saprospiraceae bacterium]|nr:NAD(P) transhydrogenase subunit alpha [Saprospiraceae bacterium]HMQ82601.1 NAD(P) transhydrogenase subunit alpha [Saprospiraceae bacterium]
MKLAVLKEDQDTRVALVPGLLEKFKVLGLEIWVEKGAGEQSAYPDDTYTEHATLSDRATILKEADILLSVRPPSDDILTALKKGCIVISMFEPYNNPEITGKLQGMGLIGASFDMIPRTTLAQSMDVLSSMASIAGYMAVLEAARLLPRYLPMMVTAAGSIRPAKVLIIGAGVAGLQAIATARRLGAMVEAFDTRLAAKEEVQSLGAKFVEVEGARDEKSAGGYAVEQSEEFLQRQRAEVQARAAKSDIIITTAQVRGRKAPVLIQKETIANMKPGSVIIDLAASTGGNCELTQDNATIQVNGVTIVGNSHLAQMMPQDASFLFSNNALNLFKTFVKDGALNLDMGNEIIRNAFFTETKAES